ncbi:MAG: hypothetical protein HOV81_28925 [Kofleriaceae bacterium]|nr:hypothetical protein [Kofleriaceae bacterium]
MLIVIHSGQTGVERGAHLAAVRYGITVAGFMPLDRRDEFGLIPEHVAAHLTPSLERGPRQAVRANFGIASAVLVLVPNAEQPERSAGVSWMLPAVRSVRIPFRIVDPSASLAEVVNWAKRIPETAGSVRIQVAGPRETRWDAGESLAKRVVGALALEE